MALGLLLLLAAEPDLAGPFAFGWFGSWTQLDARRDPLTQDGARALAGAPIEAERRGEVLRFTRRNDGWCGRVGILFRPRRGLAEISLAYHDAPVRLPLGELGPGQAWWTWERAVPTVVRAGDDVLRLAAGAQHGCFLVVGAEGTAELQIAVDPPPVGESITLTLGGPAPAPGDPAAVQLDRAAAARLRAAGFTRVSADGASFATADGRPVWALGRNVADLPTLHPTEQRRVLDRMRAAGMNTLRLLLPDCVYRPLPGVWNEAALARLGDTLERCAAAGIRVILCLEYSAAGYQYNTSLHTSPSPGDLYVLDELERSYAELVEKVARPLADETAILAWDVTNEPFCEPDPTSLVLPERYAAWAEARGLPTTLPTKEEFERQSTAGARLFFAEGQRLLAERLVRRARILRAAVPRHLLTVSGWNPLLLRGVPGAEVFDFWAPHTYDLWANGPLVEEHTALLQHLFRRALPDRPRPVLIEEFGIEAGPDFGEAMRAEHVAQFLAATRRHGLAGLLHWWDLSPSQEQAYAAAQPWRPEDLPAVAELAICVPAAEQWRLIVYDAYMTRRRWGRALSAAVAAGWAPRYAASAAEAEGCPALLVLGGAAALSEAERAAFAAYAGHRVDLADGSAGPETVAAWRELLPPRR